jgi:hypothetical protein
MAKARDIAALAGLAGLAYAMRNKGDKEDAGDQKTSFYTGDTKKVEAKDEPRRQISDYMKKAPADAESGMQSNMLKAITAPKAAPNDQAGNQGVLSPKSLASDKRDIVSKKQMDDYKNKFGQDKTLKDYMNSQRASKNAPIKPVSLPDSYKRGGATKMASGGMTASRRADGIATKGKTRGKIC